METLQDIEWEKKMTGNNIHHVVTLGKKQGDTKVPSYRNGNWKGCQWQSWGWAAAAPRADSLEFAVLSCQISKKECGRGLRRKGTGSICQERIHKSRQVLGGCKRAAHSATTQVWLGVKG